MQREIYLQRHLRININIVARALRSIPSYLYHLTPKRKNQPLGHHETFTIGENVQGDLAHLYESNGFKYLSVIVDMFSKKLWVRPLKRKTPEELIVAVQEVLNDGVDIQTFSSDRGTEYTGAVMANFLEKNHILFRPKVGPSKAWLAEHYIFLVKKRLFLLLRSSGLTEWEKYVSVVCKNLNNSSNKTIGNMTPSEVNNATEFKVREARNTVHFLDWKEQLKNKFDFHETRDDQPIIIGDYVYKYNKYEPLGKSHDTQIGRLYIVAGIKTEMRPLMYKLHGLLGEDIPGHYHAWEIVKSPVKPDKDTYWTIKPQDKYEERIRNGVKEIHVQYLFYPPS